MHKHTPTITHTHTQTHAAGSDYTDVMRTLTITSTRTTDTIDIPIIDDDISEPVELFLVQLTESSLERVTVNPASAVVNIADDDGEY